MKSRFAEQQIVGILKEGEAGVKTADLCRKHSVSSATYYAWKSKFGGMEVSDVVKMHALEDENCRLKLLLADSTLEIDALKLIAAGNLNARAAATSYSGGNRHDRAKPT